MRKRSSPKATVFKPRRKAWGAVAHQLKVVAKQRGWTYANHSQTYSLVHRLAKELNSKRLKELFPVANNLHQNFYVDSKPIEQIRDEIETVKELLSLLELAELRGIQAKAAKPPLRLTRPKKAKSRKPRGRRL